MNAWLIFILIVISLSYTLDLVVTSLNIQALSPELPEEFSDTYNKDEYKKSQDYTRATSKFELVETTFSTLLILLFMLLGGFNILDLFARSFGYGSIITGLIFTFLFLFIFKILALPFSIYSTFVIEEKFGFNQTNAKTYIADLVKSSLLSLLVGGPLLALILWFFETGGQFAWLYCWLGVIAFSSLLQLLAPIIILPLFNKFTPLEDGPLRDKIDQYASDEKFKVTGIFTMDGSKRSTKANAFFTGLGRFKKIALYDNLIDKLAEDELVAILAHEMGHYKLHHIPKNLIASTVQTGIMFYLLSLFIENEGLFQAFSMDHLSIYASLFFFAFLYSPVSLLLSTLFYYFSRKNELQADQYAAQSTRTSHHLINALKKLSQSNLSNLTPHPLYIFLRYSHPPVLERIQALKQKISAQSVSMSEAIKI